MIKSLRSLVLSRGEALSNSTEQRLALLVILGTIPAVVVGAAIKSAVEEYFRDPLIVGLLFVATGLLLLVADRLGKRIHNMAKIRWPDALVVGGAQILGLLPGVSRSGVTIAAGLLRDMSRETAARFSFLLAAPLILGAGVLEAVEFLQPGSTSEIPWAWFLIGAIVSAITAFICIKWLLRFLQWGTLKPFIVYCVLVGVLVVVTDLVTS